MTAIMMGDLNAVYALQLAHRRQLICAGSLHPETMLLGSQRFPRAAVIGDVYLDDLAVFILIATSRRHTACVPPEVVRADNMYDAGAHAHQPQGVGRRLLW